MTRAIPVLRNLPLIAIIMFMAAMSLFAIGHADAATQIEWAIDTPDGARHALIVPAGDGPHPTVLVLHGALGTAALTARATGFAEAAARNGFTAVFPDGLDRRWNDGRTGGRGGPDDVAFLRALVARLIAERVAPADRIFIAGISNGGMMSFTMACRAPGLFAAIGTVIANMPAGVEPCAFKPVPLVMVNGTADPMVPYAGGAVSLRGGQVLGVDDTLRLFTTVDGCAADPVSTALPAQASEAEPLVTRVAWTVCKPGTSVTLYRVEGGGHAVFGRRALALGLLGSSTKAFVAADVIVDAFAATK